MSKVEEVVYNTITIDKWVILVSTISEIVLVLAKSDQGQKSKMCKVCQSNFTPVQFVTITESESNIQFPIFGIALLAALVLL